MLLKPGIENKEYWFMFSGIDKVLHLTVFTLLGFIFRISFSKQLFSIFLQIMLIYAFLTEILQEEMQLGRSMETLDVIFDSLGVIIGYIIFEKIKVKRF